MSEDYYSILGVSSGAGEVEIKKAFRKKAMELHPDRNPGDKVAEEKFKKLQEAHAVLSDAKKRAMYDKVGHSQFEQMQAGGGFNEGQQGGFGGAEGFDFFDAIFGNFRQEENNSGAQRGQHLRVQMRITLEEAFHGIEKEISIESLVGCEVCAGTGSHDKEVSTCAQCGGSGQTRMQRGFMLFAQTCRGCQGAGHIIKNPCRSCKGQGAMFGHRRVKMTIPAGVEDDVQLRLSGQGHAGVRGAPPGDLFVHVLIEDHELFLRQDDVVLCRAPISMIQAALGGEVELPTIEGKRVNVTVPAGSQTGDRLRLKGHGFKRYRGHGRGDMYVQLVVEIPKKLNAKQKSLLEEFSAASGDVHQPETSSFFKKVRNFLRHGDKN